MAEVLKASADPNNRLQNHSGFMYVTLLAIFSLYSMLAGRKGMAAKLKWLCCFMQSAEAKVDLPKTFKSIHASRDAVKRSLPSTVHPDELAHLEAESDTYECGCCCSDTPFKNLVQCADGHLFCFTCLKRRVEESTFGALPANGPLACMYMGGCETFIPWSEIQRSIEKGLLSRFEQRQAADDVAYAHILGMFYCPACNLACIVDPNEVVFRCPSEKCGKATCMQCKEPLHEGICCKEKTDQTKARKDVEEIMSESLIRECVACKAKIIKSSGCNKIRCRCGALMCYTCRQPIKDYNHFCQHAQGKCKSCNKCKLFHQEDSAATVKAAMKDAVARMAKKDPEILKLKIGPC